MAHYQVCVIKPDGYVALITEAICPDDRLAVLLAESMLGSDDVELWEYERKVVRLTGSKNLRSDHSSCLTRAEPSGR